VCFATTTTEHRQNGSDLVAKVVSVCFYHIRRFCQIRRRVGQEVTTRLVLAMVTTHLDYCNSLLAGLLQSTLEPLYTVSQKKPDTCDFLQISPTNYDQY